MITYIFINNNKAHRENPQTQRRGSRVGQRELATERVETRRLGGEKQSREENRIYNYN